MASCLNRVRGTTFREGLDAFSRVEWRQKSPLDWEARVPMSGGAMTFSVETKSGAILSFHMPDGESFGSIIETCSRTRTPSAEEVRLGRLVSEVVSTIANALGTDPATLAEHASRVGVMCSGDSRSHEEITAALANAQSPLRKRLAALARTPPRLANWAVQRDQRFLEVDLDFDTERVRVVVAADDATPWAIIDGLLCS